MAKETLETLVLQLEELKQRSEAAEEKAEKYKEAYLYTRQTQKDNKNTASYIQKVAFYEQVDTTCPCMKTFLCMRKHLMPKTHKRVVKRYYTKHFKDEGKHDIELFGHRISKKQLVVYKEVEKTKFILDESIQ